MESCRLALPDQLQAIIDIVSNPFDGNGHRLIGHVAIPSVVNQRSLDPQGVQGLGEFGMHIGAALKAVERISLPPGMNAFEQLDALHAFIQAD